MSNGLGRKILACAGFLLLSTVRADIIYPVPERLPPIPSEETKSCAELDQEIVSVLPLTYPSRPGIYEDPINGARFLGRFHVFRGGQAGLRVTGLYSLPGS